MHAWLSLALGLIMAWLIITFAIPQRTVSYYTLRPWPLELDDSNLALIGVGLASRVEPRPSVMDSTPAPPANVIMSQAMMRPRARLSHACITLGEKFSSLGSVYVSAWIQARPDPYFEPTWDLYGPSTESPNDRASCGTRHTEARSPYLR